MKRILPLMFMFPLLLSGCASVISKELMTEVDRTLHLRQVREDPEAYEGKLVMWAGVIIEAQNSEEGTLIEILGTAMTGEGRPRDVDRSEGRFLGLYEGYLDAAVYAEGRDVTVAGEIQGKRVLPLGGIHYTYPLVLAEEIYLWPKKEEKRICPYPCWRYPRGWYEPYWGPW